MVEPIKAAVRPRVIDGRTQSVVLLEDLVSDMLSSDDTQGIELFARPVAGVTTALQHLAFHFGTDPHLRAAELNRPVVDFDRRPAALIVCQKSQTHGMPVIKCSLAAWERDDWIEYLLAVHTPQCASVMKRIQNDPDVAGLHGNPNLIRQVLDEMAGDTELRDIKSALQRIVERQFPSVEQRLATGRRIVLRLFLRDDKQSAAAEKILSPDLFGEQLRLLYNQSILTFLAVEAAWHDMQQNLPSASLPKTWTRELIAAVAPKVAEFPHVQRLLARALAAGKRDDHPWAVSLLNLAKVPLHWPPKKILGFPVKALNLKGAILDDADCTQIRLSGCKANDASFTRAQLNGANLRRVIANRAIFKDADLREAYLTDFMGGAADFSGANLSKVVAERMQLPAADLSFACFVKARLDRCSFVGANLTSADLKFAKLTDCIFHRACLDGASFRDAILDRSNFMGVDLTVADFCGATFRSARLGGCSMEEMELPRADFGSAILADAMLTGSIMPRADFSNADLSGAKLAEVEWESADLRHADLTGATFHMGSSRSGIVDSSIPMEGSRTGFYRDEWNEQDFKSPEEIRKANLRGADLSGANIDGVDFYLVDLRDALYDADQIGQLRRTGAILETRIC